MRTFIKVIAGILAVPAVFIVGAVGVGVYQGWTAADDVYAKVEAFELHLEELDGCGDGDEAAYNANPACAAVCDSYFQCRNDFLIMEDMLNEEVAALHSDVYTEAEYESIYGRIDYAETIAVPNNPPKPILD